MKQVPGLQGVFRSTKVERLMRAEPRPLPGALPDKGAAASASRACFIAAKGLPLPATGGFYVLEAVGEGELAALTAGEGDAAGAEAEVASGSAAVPGSAAASDPAAASLAARAEAAAKPEAAPGPALAPIAEPRVEAAPGAQAEGDPQTDPSVLAPEAPERPAAPSTSAPHPDGPALRVVAYVDPFGRAFSEDAPLIAPPAREPDMQIARFPNQEDASREGGYVYVREEEGAMRPVAQYRFERKRYRLFDTWYRFGDHAANLSYEEAMARAYLAFVRRPQLGSPDVPSRAIERMLKGVSREEPVAGLIQLVRNVRRAERDPMLEAPAIVASLVRWLVDAGVDRLAERSVPGDALRMVPATKYAHLVYLAPTGDDCAVSRHEVWALEAALNRFLLVTGALGHRTGLAGMGEVAQLDANVAETVAMQHPQGGMPEGVPKGRPGGEWELRCLLGLVIEQLVLPYRVEAVVRFDATSGTVAFDMTVPDGSLMPRKRWDGSGAVEAVRAEGASAGEAGRLVSDGAEHRDALARRYAMHVGLLLACAAFEGSPDVSRVCVVARPLPEDSAEAPVEEGEGKGSKAESQPKPQSRLQPQPQAFFHVSFDRAAYESRGNFQAARVGDPLPTYLACGIREDAPDEDMAPILRPAGSGAVGLPEVGARPLGEEAREAIGVESTSDLRIEYDRAYRSVAEGLADDIVRATTATEAIRIVRTVQDEAISRRDERAASGCTRLMEALASGDIDAGDQNAVVARFLGEDRCQAAIARAAGLADQHKADEAVGVLKDAIAEAEALDGFVDGSSEVFRSFDSYGARVLYNRSRAGIDSVVDGASADAGKHVRLVPDSFYLCHLEVARLLEHSFERTEEALRYGRRAVQIAPATAAGYRQLGRAYMLVGDTENAAAVLLKGLRIAVQPGDIAFLYYQLAYVLWKAGNPAAGAGCYLKAIAASPSVAMQATSELQELINDTGLSFTPHEDLDMRLMLAGVPLAPYSGMLDAIDDALVAAADEGLLPVARSLLTLRLRWRPDDALMGVLKSYDAK